jgi:glycine hydroxymethyltransferase
LSNKYAEGYPGRRYYGGCAEVDKAEIIGIERAKALFGADHANLQPHREQREHRGVRRLRQAGREGPGDEPAARRAPDPRHQGLLLGQVVRRVHYGVRQDTEDIDYDQVRDLAREHQPKMIICGGSAYRA